MRDNLDIMLKIIIVFSLMMLTINYFFDNTNSLFPNTMGKKTVNKHPDLFEGIKKGKALKHAKELLLMRKLPIKK